MVKIRLSRVGARNRPFYRIIAIDERRKLNGRALEFLGTYDPRPAQGAIRLDGERIDAWLKQGAQLSPAVKALVRRARRAQPSPPAAGA